MLLRIAAAAISHPLTALALADSYYEEKSLWVGVARAHVVAVIDLR